MAAVLERPETREESPVSTREGVIEKHVKILMPALMAHAGSIQSHGPEASEALLALLKITGAMPSYGVYQSPEEKRREARRQKDEMDDLFPDAARM